MKKGMSKLLSALLIATLVFTSAGVAFADTGGSEGLQKAEASKTSVEQFSKNELAATKKAITSVKKAAATPKTTVGYINVATYVTGSEIPEAAVVPAEYRNNKYGFSQAYNAPANGTIQIAAGAEERGVTYGLFSDPAMTSPVDGTGYASANAPTARFFKVPSAGTYYIGAYASGSVSALAMTAAFANGADRTITAGTRVTVGQKDAQTNYFKFKAKQTGYLMVESTDYGKVTLCKSNKKALSNATSTYYAPTYGVKKGTTYYIKVAVSNYNYDGYYQLQVTNKKITEKSGKKKSKAVTIKKKKTKKGTIIAGSSQADWYKFKLGGKKKETLTMKGATNNKLKVVVYNKKGKKVSSAYSYNYYNNKLTLKSYGKLAKGTYYIKVYRGTKTSSGWYSLSWK